MKVPGHLTVVTITVLLGVGCTLEGAHEQYLRGYNSATGFGGPQDSAQAVVLYQKAAERGCSDAQVQLGKAYEVGIGIPQDDALAMYWYRRAAEGELRDGCYGRRFAQSKLAYHYSAGEICKVDLEESAFWYCVSAPEAEDSILGTIRDGTLMLLAPEVRAVVISRAEIFRMNLNSD